MTLWDQMFIAYDVLGFAAFLATLAFGMTRHPLPGPT